MSPPASFWVGAREGSGPTTNRERPGCRGQGWTGGPGQREGSVLGVPSRPAPPRRHGFMPGRPPPAGDTHLRRRHPARPVRSSGNSARLLPGPPVPGRGRRSVRTNRQRPPALAANGRLSSERSEGIPPPNLGLPRPCAQWSDLTWSKWWRAEPLRGCAGGGRTGDRAGAGGKSQMTGFGGLCAGIQGSGLFGRSARGLRASPSPASLPERLILQSGP